MNASLEGAPLALPPPAPDDLRRRWQHPALSRQAVFLLVVALHAGFVLLLMLAGAPPKAPVAAPSIEAQLLNENPAPSEPAPPVPPKLTPPQIDAIVPDVPIVLPAPDAPVALPPSKAAAAQGSPGPADPVSPPSFDAAYLNNPAPDYPMASRRAHEQGTSLLRVRVSPQGTALQVLIETTSGSARLDAAAVEAVRRWRFVPAHQGSQAVEAWVLVPVEFELHR